MPVIIPIPEHPIIIRKQSIAEDGLPDSIHPDPNKPPNNVVQVKYTGKKACHIVLGANVPVLEKKKKKKKK